MAIYKEDIVAIELQSGTIHRSFLGNTIGSGDRMANRFGVSLFRDGQPVSAESSTVAGVFMAPDGNNYGINETNWPGSTGKEGNKAWVQLPEICYAVTGQFTLAIKLSGGSVEGTMRIVDGMISETGEAGAVVPTSTIPTTADIIAAYEEAVDVIGGSVRFDASQTLSDSEQETARENIGSAGIGQVVRVDADQSLTDTQKSTARGNIGSASDEDVTILENALLVSEIVENEEVDLDDYKTEGRTQFRTSVTFQNAPAYVKNGSAAELTVINMNNGAAFMQVFTDFTYGNKYARYYTTNTEEFNEWKEVGNGVIRSFSAIDFNDYVSTGRLYLPAVNYKASTNIPSSNVNGSCILSVSVSDNGVVIQTAELPVAHMHFIRYRDTQSVWQDWSTVGGSIILDSNDVAEADLNDYLSEGTFIFRKSVEITDKPLAALQGPYILEVKNVNNATIFYQRLTDATFGLQYERYTNSELRGEWLGITSTHAVNVENEPSIDFDDMVIPGCYYYASAQMNTAENAPINTSGSLGILNVIKETKGVIYQELTLPLLNVAYTRRRGYALTWSEWTLRTMPKMSVLFTAPLMSKVTFNGIKKRKNIQEIAVYDGHIFDFGSGVVSVDGGDNISITNGHGNNAMFGTELHGDFPYLYCGSWNNNDCKVYVNQVTTESATLVRTISFSTLTGHLNMCVDEPNGKIYILLTTTSDTSTGDTDFIVADLSSGAIISRITLPYKIPVPQGMEFHNGLIYCTHGKIPSNATNHVLVLDTTGQIIQKSDPIDVEEIEGISFDNGTVYLADTGYIYY